MVVCSFQANPESNIMADSTLVTLESDLLLKL